jgi:hypothetical protein
MALARSILGKFLGVVCHCFTLGKNKALKDEVKNLPMQGIWGDRW